MDEYVSYLATLTANRQIFLLNFHANFHAFETMFRALQTAWARLGTERDRPGRSQVGLLPFANILARHTLVGFEHLTYYQSFLAWLAFRPGLEAFLMIGKFVEDPANADIWKNRQSDWKSYKKTFSGSALESKSLAQSAAYRQILTHLNGEFIHPNPDFAYRDAAQKNNGKSVLLEIQCFDGDPDIHEGHLLAYLNLLDLVVVGSENLVTNLCGPPVAASTRETYSKQQFNRAKQLATKNGVSKKVMEELGNWKV